MHAKSFEFGFCFTNLIVGSESWLRVPQWKGRNPKAIRASMGSRMADSKQSRAAPLKNERNIIDLISICPQVDLCNLGSWVCTVGLKLWACKGQNHRMDLVPVVWVWSCLLLFKTLLIASANVVASAWELVTGVSLSVGLIYADPRCAEHGQVLAVG